MKPLMLLTLALGLASIVSAQNDDKKPAARPHRQNKPYQMELRSRLVTASLLLEGVPLERTLNPCRVKYGVPGPMRLPLLK